MPFATVGTSIQASCCSFTTIRRHIMFGKQLHVSAVLVCVLIISGPVYADVVGSWDVSAIVRERITIKGAGSAGERGQAVDHFVFGQDGSFTMIDLPPEAGTWGYVKKKFAVYLDNSALETYWADALEEMLWFYGIDADVDYLTITQNVFTGKENTKKDTIKGKWILMFEAYLYVYNVGRGFDMKVKVTTNFTGVRSTGTGALTVESTPSEELSEEARGRTLIEGVCNQIRKAIVGRDPEQ